MQKPMTSEDLSTLFENRKRMMYNNFVYMCSQWHIYGGPGVSRQNHCSVVKITCLVVKFLKSEDFFFPNFFLNSWQFFKLIPYFEIKIIVSDIGLLLDYRISEKLLSTHP